MIGVGEKFPAFTLQGVDKDNNFVTVSVTEQYEPLKKDYTVIYFYPKDFTFVCPTEISEFASLNSEFEDRDCVVLGGSSDNEFCKLAWRREHSDLNKLSQWSFSDTNGSLIDSLGIRSEEGVALRATFIIDPHNVIQHVYVTNLNVGRNPQDTLRVLDALQTDELCPCNRPVGGETIQESGAI